MVAAPPLPPSPLLVPGRTLLFLPSLVSAIGLNEAIILQQLRYRLADERAPHVWQGRRWARASHETWQRRDFPFWSLKTISRTFDALERRGFIETAQPDRSSRDGTKWYTINPAALEPLTRLHAGRGGGRPVPAGAPVIEDGLPPLPASDLLLAEPPLVIVVALAEHVGLDEAILLQQLRYWLADERKPPIRDGRRWVCPRDVDFFAPLTHRSPIVLQRTLNTLESAGLIHSTTRYNSRPGDRTKWYTLDFAAIERLVQAPRATDTDTQTHEMSIPNNTICLVPTTSVDQVDPNDLSDPNCRDCPNPSTPIVRFQAARLSNSLNGSETDRETDPGNEQQQPTPEGVVVVQTLIEKLIERGITATVARSLSAQVATPIIERQLEIYDWLREESPDDPRLTPGRLRRMVADDWAVPAGFRPAAERAAARAAADRRQAVDRAMDADRRAIANTAQRERRDLLARLGLSEADQALWARLVQQAPPLPALFRGALFYAPADQEGAAAVILPDLPTLARANGPAHAAVRGQIARRIAALCRPGLTVHYLDLDTLRGQLEPSQPLASDSLPGGSPTH